MSLPIPPGFKNEDGSWSQAAIDRFFGDKNKTALEDWAKKQRETYKDDKTEKGDKLREKYKTEEELEAYIKETFQKKYDALVGKAAKSARVFFKITLDDVDTGRIVI